jgi:hypothetical protein
VGKKCLYAFSTSSSPREESGKLNDEDSDTDGGGLAGSSVLVEVKYLSFNFHEVNDRY